MRMNARTLCVCEKKKKQFMMMYPDMKQVEGEERKKKHR